MVHPVFLHYTYYHCAKSKVPRCPQKCITGQELETQIHKYLGRIQISDRFKDWAIKYLRELNESERCNRSEVINAQQRAYQDCLRRVDNLLKLKTSSNNTDGILISDEEYHKQRVDLLKEKAALEELLKDAGHRVEKWLQLSEKTFDFACTARERFAKGDPQTKREILAAVGSNLVLKDKQLSIEAGNRS